MHTRGDKLRGVDAEARRLCPPTPSTTTTTTTPNQRATPNQPNKVRYDAGRTGTGYAPRARHATACYTRAATIAQQCEIGHMPQLTVRLVCMDLMEIRKHDPKNAHKTYPK